MKHESFGFECLEIFLDLRDFLECIAALVGL